MSELNFKRQSIEAEKVAPVCPRCNQGYLIHFGTPLKTNPKQWQHKCSGCGDMSYLTKPYPILMVEGQEYGPLDAVRYEVDLTKGTHGNG